MNTDKHPQILVVSGFDPSGGAGLVADIETVHALGCCTSAVITCQTIQTRQNATVCVPSDTLWFKRQLYSVIEAHSFSAVKIGLTPSIEIIDIVADVLVNLSCPIVIDPIIAAGGGYVFCDSRTVNHLAEKLIPLGNIATPNAKEINHFAETSKQAVSLLLERGCKAVLVSSEYEKAGYLYHCLYRLQHSPQLFTVKRLPYRYHGGGCTLASAIAAYSAHGMELVAAVRQAQEFTYNCLQATTSLPQGVAVPQRFKQ